MSMDKKFLDVIDMKCHNGGFQTVFDIAFSSSTYSYAIKLAFDEKDDHTDHIKQIILHVSEGYDAKNPWIMAIREGQSDIVKILLKSRLFDVNGKDCISNDAPLLQCIRAIRDAKLLKLLNTATKDECKAYLNLATTNKRLPFHYACAAIVRYFKELSQSDKFGDIVDLDIVDGDNKFALQLAVDNRYRDIIGILFDETKLNQSQLNLVFWMFVTEYDKSKYDESCCKRLSGIKGILSCIE